MKKEPRGRLYQDSEFSFNELNGLKIDQLIICENSETTELILVYLKVRGKNWNKFFLDAGIGFWENWNEIDTEDDSYNFKDCTEKYGLKNEIISKIYCSPDSINSRIVVELNNNEKLVLKCVDPDITDSEYELIKSN